ncbi:hypothetical protein [Serpentinicella alkaliphila]|uniref:Uncharacterized protein n=1 Tax=Serpentinicella alkaliphila TaxID=1734049 RepID=A0A4R2TCK7_9FIRM|nr:hypothetical protein [Serpentinicella alkaliphila]QUH25711.1 hypothetical protein HZR23_08130 [Serpentinicella alkaliphila]TCP94828.1 hypothetical protein EDD79_10716 [Serpentinicella alkaliphila]
MNNQYEIYFYHKAHGYNSLDIFIDGQLVDNKKGKYTWRGSDGKHQIRITQVKMHQSKWYWITSPVFFLLGVLAYDLEGFDDKTPFYAVYEANILVDKDMIVKVSLKDINKHKGESKEGYEYKIKVDFPEEANIEVTKEEFVATKKERVKWFLTHAALLSVVFSFVMFIGVGVGISSLKTDGEIFVAMLSLLISAGVMVGWIFIIYKMYRYSQGKY